MGRDVLRDKKRFGGHGEEECRQDLRDVNIACYARVVLRSLSIYLSIALLRVRVRLYLCHAPS